MHMAQIKKPLVLITLFVLPVLIYLFFASGVTKFGKLSLMTENVPEISTSSTEVVLKDKITILGFLGSVNNEREVVAFNLNQKIYKRFYKFNDFQFVMMVPKGAEEKVEELKKELGQLEDISKWNFVFADESEIRNLFKGLQTNLSLEDDLGSPKVFIIDKNKNLRGRDNDEDEGLKFGYDCTSVSELNNKMVDDVKILLAEYRMALKSNNAERIK
ncbi:hypothetical protein SAMN04487911_11183 [Arenibacter nanhaiticus]|uniref:Uncharacterized protein n=2 Tax=Arenibacter nanhaiticus TaxID=558155 RepID=A0A1M6GP33_9FLAO|nr:hypothetical protein SAMN04487911_11183 [Arenibacter nanhaiticus]